MNRTCAAPLGHETGGRFSGWRWLCHHARLLLIRQLTCTGGYASSSGRREWNLGGARSAHTQRQYGMTPIRYSISRPWAILQGLPLRSSAWRIGPMPSALVVAAGVTARADWMVSAASCKTTIRRQGAASRPLSGAT